MGKGATGQMTSEASSEQSFSNTLQSDFGTAFSGQQNIINNLSTALTSTMKAGPEQFGFPSAETSSLNTTATSGVSTALQNTKAAVGESAAAGGGGGATLPSGSQAETNAALEQNAAQNKSNSLLEIQKEGYAQGNKNYNTAVSGLTNAASLENPSGLASEANSASKTAFNQAKTVYQENQSASAWSKIGGLIGSLSPSAIMQGMPGMGGGSNASQIGSADGSAYTDSGDSMTGANDLGMDYGSSDLGGAFGEAGDAGSAVSFA